MQVFGGLAHNMVQNSSYTIKGMTREYVSRGRYLHVGTSLVCACVYAPEQENCFRSDGVLLSLALDVLNRQVGDLSQLLELEKESADIRSHAVNGPSCLAEVRGTTCM